MRLRTFTARTMPEAMALVREQLGSEAIILSTARANGGISVTAALDQADAPAAPENVEAEPPEDPVDFLHEMLTAPGTPAPPGEKLLSALIETPAPHPPHAPPAGIQAAFSFPPPTHP